MHEKQIVNAGNDEYEEGNCFIEINTTGEKFRDPS